ncbi:MAG: CoA-binding protein [Bdellovibrionota bacterium]
MNVDTPQIQEILTNYRKVAVVGLSPEESRPSNEIARYLIAQGYEVCGVRPGGIREILGRPCYAKLADVPGELEIVDVFRSPEHIPALVAELLPLKPKVLWLQLGVTHPEAERLAERAGIQVISNRCILVDHQRLVK